MSRLRTTEAAVLVELGRPLELMTLEIPALKPGQVLVDVAYSGVCHSQLNEARGKRGPDRFLPHCMGHEGAGTVVEVGEGVTKVRVGDPVVLSWIKGDGMDVPGTVYGSARGAVNSGACCTFMRRTVTCESRVTPLPATMPLQEAALLGCAIPTGGGMILNTASVQPGQAVAVFGVGGIGLSAVMVAAMVGASPVIAVDINPAHLEQALSLGATHVIDAGAEVPAEAIARITAGRGVDVSVEAAGRPEVMAAAFQAARNFGGLCILAGNVAFGERLSIDPFDLIRGKKLVGSWGGESVPDRDVPRYAAFHAQGKLPLNRLISHEFPLEGVNDALDALERGEVGRAIINMG
ncbi:MAG TPA: zinc-binding dehydrogenase [Magnetospirillum sp.]|nr:zinc-binding dehydrogenase [Magnetospirillum sp.]